MADLHRVTIVGAGLAGHASARALRRLGYDGELTLVGAEPDRPYDRPPLSKQFLAGTMGADELALERDDENLAAEWLLGRRAVALDPGTHAVTLDDGRLVRADAVVVATGSRARRLGTDPLRGVHTLRTLADAVALRAELHPGARLVVVGAGFVGAEVAATARSLGLDVTVLEAAAAPLVLPLGPVIGAAVAGLHERHGARLLCGVGVDALTGTDRVTGVRLADGHEIAADVVVVGIGAAPDLGWLPRSGLSSEGGLRCGASGATDASGVYGVGDCAAWFDPALGRHRRIEHWTDSRDRPAHAMAALLGAPLPRLRAPYFWSDQYGVRIQFAGTRRGDEEIEILDGSVDTDDLLVVYRRAGQPVAVLGLNQPRAFTRWRKQLSDPSREAVTV